MRTSANSRWSAWQAQLFFFFYSQRGIPPIPTSLLTVFESSSIKIPEGNKVSGKQFKYCGTWKQFKCCGTAALPRCKRQEYYFFFTQENIYGKKVKHNETQSKFLSTGRSDSTLVTCTEVFNKSQG